jgi:hypothetical protein
MLAEAFILRLEAISRSIATQLAASTDRRFVPIKLPVKPAEKSAADK